MPSRYRILALSAEPLSVPLVEPFVIATGRMDATRAAVVVARVQDVATGREATGLGEAAALPPVTAEDQPDLLEALAAAGPRLAGATFGRFDGLAEALDAALPGRPVSRAGAETAILDAVARLDGVPLRALLGGARGAATTSLETDITIPIHEPSHMGRLAASWRAKGFRTFKVKVGKDLDADLAALDAIARAAPGCPLRIDANAGFTAAEALRLLDEAARHRLPVECFEQPCGRDDLAGMAEVAAATEVPVVADESVRTLAELRAVIDAGAADGVNLKLAKSGGPLGAYELGAAAQAAGLAIMCGGMIETRLGMTAAAHVAAALGGVAYVDLDTAWLLASDPFRGGYVADGPRYTLPAAPGLGVER